MTWEAAVCRTPIHLGEVIVPYKTRYKEASRHVKELVSRVKGVAVKAGGFLGRRKRLTIAVVVAALLLGPLLTTDGELVFLNGSVSASAPWCSGGSSGPEAGRGRDGRNRHNGNGRQEQQHNTKEDTMTTQATTIGGTGTRPRRSLEELVDRLMEALFRDETETAVQTGRPGLTRSVHEARRLRQAGDLDGALAVFAGVDTARAETREARWAYAEWTDLVRRRLGDRDALVYSQGAGRAAALVPKDDGSLEVAAVLGMRWEPGKAVSRRSLRGLRPLSGGA